MAALDAELKQIANELEGRLANDNGVPRNIRKGATNAVELLLDNNKALDLRISNAINIPTSTCWANGSQASMAMPHSTVICPY